ncbi:hypothetical protein [Thermococcus sp. JCM 11816]|uniref:hypothetical protein n=1 Tax=Thermococcus sp. (strain JCM 11816 / KS-1) TaxID=1295125 RepID=UPI0006D292E4
MLEYEILSAGGVTALFTAISTAYVTSKVNQKQLSIISKKLDEMEKRLYNHENRLSRIEGGKLNGSVRI